MFLKELIKKTWINCVSFCVVKTVIVDGLSQWYPVIHIYAFMYWCVYLRLLNNTVCVDLLFRKILSLLYHALLVFLYVCSRSVCISHRRQLALLCTLVKVEECQTPWPTIAVLSAISCIDTGARLQQPGLFLNQSRFVTSFNHTKDISYCVMYISSCFCHLVCW